MVSLLEEEAVLALPEAVEAEVVSSTFGTSTAGAVVASESWETAEEAEEELLTVSDMLLLLQLVTGA